MKRLITSFLSAGVAASMIAAVTSSPTVIDTVSVTSPNGWLKFAVDNTDGSPSYAVTYTGIDIMLDSPLGLTADYGDFSKDLKLVSVKKGSIDKKYKLDRIKKSDNRFEANSLECEFVNPKGDRMILEVQVAHCNIAFRYKLPKPKGRGAVRVMNESTGFHLPSYATGFLTPQSDAMVGWKRTKPSYEEEYIIDAPIDTKSKYGHGFTFPAVFHIGDKAWTLVSETGVDRNYCGSRLSDPQNGLFTLQFPMPEENNGNGTVEPAFSLPGATPWRLITVGHSPRPLATTTLPWDVVEEKFSASEDFKPGKSTWSWILWQDDAINMEDSKKYIDLAAEMGYPYTLIDAGWDKTMGRDGIVELVEYGKDKGVAPFLWYSSSGYWNDIEQSPINKMDDPTARKAEMRWMKEIGVKGIKVDFFGGDKQETMRLYEDILSDANDNGLMVIFHGCTLPRGWEKMYPNYVGSEAVLASENMIFSQDFCDNEAVNATLHPIIRNAVGAMEYGGTFLNKRLNRGNDGGNRRMTSDAFQLALAVIYQSPVQNFALAPNNLTDADPIAIDFMREVPTLWDDVALLEGYPGKFIVLSRKSGDKWYVAGINAEKATKELALDLDSLGEGKAVMISDGKNGKLRKEEITISKGKKKKVSIPASSGFVIIKKI